MDDTEIAMDLEVPRGEEEVPSEGQAENESGMTVADQLGLDELFGEKEEEDAVKEEATTQDTENLTENTEDIVKNMEVPEDEAAKTRKRLNLALFGDDETESEDEEMSEQDTSPKKKSSRNILGKKEISLPPCPRLDSSNVKPCMLKLPGFIAVEAEPYSRDRLEDEEVVYLDTDEQGNLTKEGLLRLSTSIRWNEDGGTNTNLIKWSDGSYSLVVGQEHFEVQLQNTQKENSFLFTRHPKEGCMEANAKVTERLVVRPFVTADQSHRKFLALSSTATDSSLPVGRDPARVKMAVTVADPEREKQRMIKLEQEKIKSKRKLEMRRRNLQQRSYDRVARTGLSARFLEEEEGGAGSEDLDRYEDDFIDDNGGESVNDDDVEEEAEEDEDYNSDQGEEMDEESEAQMTDGSDSQDEDTSRKRQEVSSGRKTAKIADSDED